MWDLIPRKSLPPTRRVRYCCEVLKEHGGKNRCIITGVRWAESRSRSNNSNFIQPNKKDDNGKWIGFSDNDESRREFEACPIKGKTTINPIIDWSDHDVWNFAKSEKLLMNPLYECGFDRVGCIGCPLANANTRYKEFRMYPAYENNYRRTFSKLLEIRKNAGKSTGQWKSADDVFQWWMEDKNVDGQMTFEE